MTRAPRLPPEAVDALDALRAAVDDADRLTMADTKAVLDEADRFTGEPSAVLDLLEARGYIYTVGGVVRVTPTEE